jgi:hypothetical protein
MVTQPVNFYSNAPYEEKLGGFRPGFPLYPTETDLRGWKETLRKSQQLNQNPETKNMKNTRLILLIAVFAAAIASPDLRGATIIVTEASDSGPGTLRQALADAQDGDTITFDQAIYNTLWVTHGDLVVDKSVAIVGLGANRLTVDAEHANRIFYISPNKTVSISGLTIANGSAPSPYFGGGIYNDHGNLTVSSCTITGNVAVSGVGGGIFNDNGTLTVLGSTLTGNSTWYGGAVSTNWLGGGTATVTITNSTLSGNTASYGGGIINENATLILSNSTVNGNSAEYGGGGLDNGGYAGTSTVAIINSTLSANSAAFGGGVLNDANGTMTISNSTFSGNSAGTGHNVEFDGFGGGIWNVQTLTITNSTLSGNSALTEGGAICNGGNFSNPILKIGGTIFNASSSGGNIYNESGTTISLGYNLSSDDGAGYLTGTADRINTDPRLGPLQNNGGPTFTHLPAPNSPAIDGNDPALAMDQRGAGFARVVNGRADIGAVEVQVAPSPTPTPTPTPTPRPHGRR